MRARMMLAAGLVGLSGCGGAVSDGPPGIRLGMDECAACGMIISDEKASGALSMEGERGVQAALFDDIGCLLDYREDQGASRVKRVWVHDYAGRAWIDGAGAAYLRAGPGTITTPMGSGMVAFATRAGAEAERDRCGGEVGTLEELAGLRRAWREARRAQYAEPVGGGGK